MSLFNLCATVFELFMYILYVTMWYYVLQNVCTCVLPVHTIDSIANCTSIAGWFVGGLLHWRAEL